MNGWPVAHIAYAWRCAKIWLVRLRYPHAVCFRMDAAEFNEWYLERYRWITMHIRDPRRNVWLHSDMVQLHDQHIVQEVWMDGCLRFRKAEDALLYRMVWG